MIASDKLLRALNADSRTNLNTCIRRLLNLLGGAEGLANHIFADFQATVPGSQNRIKLEAMMVHLLETFAPVDELPDDEDQLEAVARQLNRNNGDGGGT